MKFLKYTLFTFALVVGFSMTSTAQNKDRNDPPPKKDPPVVVVKDKDKDKTKDKPKDDNRDKPKKPEGYFDPESLIE